MQFETSLTRPTGDGAATTVGDLALFAGGEARRASNVVDIYNARTGRWTSSQISKARGEITAASVGDTAFFAGGANGIADYSNVDLFNASTDQWSTASFSQARTNMAVAVVGSKVVFAGGSYGGELAATWNVTRDWKLNASYTFLSLQLHRDPGDTGTGETYFEGSSPQSQFQVRSYLNVTRNLELNSALYYVSQLKEGNIPASLRADIGLTWRPKNDVEVSLVAQNLFDNRHPEFPSTGAYTAGSEVVRQFYARVTWRL